MKRYEEKLAGKIAFDLIFDHLGCLEKDRLTHEESEKYLHYLSEYYIFDFTDSARRYGFNQTNEAYYYLIEDYNDGLFKRIRDDREFLRENPASYIKFVFPSDAFFGLPSCKYDYKVVNGEPKANCPRIASFSIPDAYPVAKKLSKILSSNEDCKKALKGYEEFELNNNEANQFLKYLLFDINDRLKSIYQNEGYRMGFNEWLRKEHGSEIDNMVNLRRKYNEDLAELFLQSDLSLEIRKITKSQNKHPSITYFLKQPTKIIHIDDFRDPSIANKKVENL